MGPANPIRIVDGAPKWQPKETVKISVDVGTRPASQVFFQVNSPRQDNMDHVLLNALPTRTNGGLVWGFFFAKGAVCVVVTIVRSSIAKI